VDANGFFEKVDGAYRVYNVKVLDQTSGEYKALDPNGKYILAGFNYFLLDFGGGMTMFKDAKILDAEGTLDVELLENYIVEHLGGVIGEEYAEVKPNISFTDGVMTETPDDHEQGNKEPSSPQTGDNSYVVVWRFLAVSGLFGLVVLGIYRRKGIPSSDQSRSA
jgi:hypothetical protein